MASSLSYRERAARQIGITAQISFWFQLGIAIVAAMIMLLGNRQMRLQSSGTGFGLAAITLALLAIAGAIFAQWRNRQLAKKLLSPNSQVWPQRESLVSWTYWCLGINWAGVLLTLIGLLVMVTSTLSIALSQTPGLVVSAPRQAVQGLEVLVIWGAVLLLAAHIGGATLSMWVLSSRASTMLCRKGK
jgi:hypothetical protein